MRPQRASSGTRPPANWSGQISHGWPGVVPSLHTGAAVGPSFPDAAAHSARAHGPAHPPPKNKFTPSSASFLKGRSRPSDIWLYSANYLSLLSFYVHLADPSASLHPLQTVLLSFFSPFCSQLLCLQSCRHHCRGIWLTGRGTCSASFLVSLSPLGRATVTKLIGNNASCCPLGFCRFWRWFR